MKFTLKDYQTDAVRDALANLKKARRRWREESDKNAFSLTAVTGAGKTVMAAAVFEALFYGADEHEFDADPGAVVIWFSDDPALNEQTRFRLMEASDRVTYRDLVVIDAAANRPKFEARKIYFLNTQKLGKNSLLVRGHEGGGLFPESRPDMHAYTIWDTIRRTIEDPALTLYLVLDEAHRGMGNPTKAAQNAKATLVLRLINGAQGVPGIPIVWGISATVDRFNHAMAGAQGRGTLPNVVVDAQKVQESGLLKDTIVLDMPKGGEKFDTVIVRRAADKLRAATQAWTDYTQRQGEARTVVPLMVLQVPNTPDPNDIGDALATLFQQYPDLASDSVAHVFGEHTAQQFGPYAVPYISPERVQDATWVRVLVAKDAISTGWDCPRAEVMVSFRAASDRTHITQLLGRMVRTPLARRIPGHDLLNSVHCLLPQFDPETATAVADALMKGSSSGDDSDNDQPRAGRVLVNPVTMTPNPAVPEAVWQKFESLPSQTRPQRGARPPRRLTALAHELATDNLLPDAGKKAHAELHKVLDAAQARWRDEIAAHREAVLTVEGQSLVADMRGNAKSLNQFWEEADLAVIDDAFKRAARVITPDIARTYTAALAQRACGQQEGEEYVEALGEARLAIAALGLLPELQGYLDNEADKLARLWLSQYRVAIKALPHARQEEYRQVREMSSEPQSVELVRPDARDEATSTLERDTVTPLPTYRGHLLCDAEGNCPAELNQWERAVVATESKRTGFVCWYRNPQQPGQSSLGVAYLDGDQHKIVRPDFVFFATQRDGTVVADLVDPHGHHLADALPKLRGLAQYAAAHGDVFRRVEAIAEVDKTLRVLDMTRADVRHAVAQTLDVAGLYRSDFASDYL